MSRTLNTLSGKLGHSLAVSEKYVTRALKSRQRTSVLLWQYETYSEAPPCSEQNASPLRTNLSKPADTLQYTQLPADVVYVMALHRRSQPLKNKYAVEFLSMWWWSRAPAAKKKIVHLHQ